MPTLDLRNSTLQELFDTAVAGLRSQGCQPAYDTVLEACRYRTEDGKKCAVGHLIPEGQYDPKWEGKAAGTLLREGLVLVPLGDRDTWHDFLRDLQSAHDDAVEHPHTGVLLTPDEARATMERNFQGLAQNYNLVYTPPEEKK